MCSVSMTISFVTLTNRDKRLKLFDRAPEVTGHLDESDASRGEPGLPGHADRGLESNIAPSHHQVPLGPYPSNWTMCRGM
jgi:hypothetical protein